MVTNQFFPRRFQISGLTNAQNAVVTFTTDHDYIVGEIISFRVTPAFGMFEIDKRRGQVLSITANTVTVDIDTSTWTTFTTALLNTSGTTPPVCVPSSSGVIEGEISMTSINDAFDNRRV